ncbi:MAG: 2-deoxystreptamine glucosyltransferase [Chloroflexi bacterium]|nr:2-deoxystreptamine glucosyltransferase [Chloroflexota bacterium]
MRILILNYEYPPVGGGGGQVSEDIAQGLAKRGHEIMVLTSHMEGLLREEVQAPEPGVRVLRLPAWRKYKFKAGLRTMLGYIVSASLAGIRWIRRWRPDLIHVHFAVPTGPVAWLLAKLTKTPYVLTVHLGDIPGGAPEKTSGWFRWAYPFTSTIWKNAAQVVAVSEFSRQLALKHYPVDIKVIRNGVDTGKISPREIKVHHPPQIIFAGRFMPQKNPLQLVRVLAKLEDLAWTCIMLGDGPLMKDVRKEIVDLGLQDRFSLPGWVTPDIVIDEFDQSDILFMPSRSEGLPMVGVQALSMGMAVVASDIGGFIDLVENGKNGYRIEPEDEEAFVNSLRGLLEDPEKLLAFRQASRQKAKTFDINYIAKQYEELFLEVR